MFFHIDNASFTFPIGYFSHFSALGTSDIFFSSIFYLVVLCAQVRSQDFPILTDEYKN